MTWANLSWLKCRLAYTDLDIFLLIDTIVFTFLLFLISLISNRNTMFLFLIMPPFYFLSHISCIFLESKCDNELRVKVSVTLVLEARVKGLGLED